MYNIVTYSIISLTDYNKLMYTRAVVQLQLNIHSPHARTLLFSSLLGPNAKRDLRYLVDSASYPKNEFYKRARSLYEVMYIHFGKT